MKRREFITLLGGTAAAWPLAVSAQQAAMPIVGLVSIRSADGSARNAAAFRKGLTETGTIEGQDVMVAYHWLDGQYDRLPAVMADLVRRRVAVIATPGLMPEAARAIGLQIQLLKASTSLEIEAAFATLVRDRADALFVAGDGFFNSRRVQFATLAARDRIPTSCFGREMVEAGLLMSYGPDNLDSWRQIGVYTGRILKGAKPAELPVVRSTKFELVINLQTARALGIEVPNSIQLLADEVIE